MCCCPAHVVLLVNTNGAKHHTKYCQCKINLLLEKSCSTKNNLIKCLLFTKSTQYYLFKIKSVNKSLNRLRVCVWGDKNTKATSNFSEVACLLFPFQKNLCINITVSKRSNGAWFLIWLMTVNLAKLLLITYHIVL